MKEAARLLDESLHGRQRSTDELMVLLGDQLHEIAQRHLSRERVDHTLQPTALVNEAYLRLLGQTEVAWKNTNHFRAIASKLMRRILVDHARAKAAGKRGCDYQRVCLSAVHLTGSDDPVELVVIHDLLEKLEELNPRLGKTVEYKIFGGLTLPEIADSLSVSLATVKKDWRFCKAWLSSQMDHDL